MPDISYYYCLRRQFITFPSISPQPPPALHPYSPMARFLTLAAAALAALALLHGAAASNVLDLTPETFDDVVNGDRHVLVEFFAPWSVPRGQGEMGSVCGRGGGRGEGRQRAETEGGAGLSMAEPKRHWHRLPPRACAAGTTQQGESAIYGGFWLIFFWLFGLAV